MPLEEGPAAAAPIHQPPMRAERVADRPGERDREIAGQPGLELDAEERDVLAGERPAATAPP